MIKSIFRKTKETLYSFIQPMASDKFQMWPADDFTPKSLKSLRDSIMDGRLDEQERLFLSMMEKWPRLQKNLREIGGAVSRLNWSVVPWSEKDESPKQEDIELAKLVDAAIWMAKPDADKWELSFPDLVRSMSHVVARGQTCHEISWATRGKVVYPRAYIPVTAMYYAWDWRCDQKDSLVLFPDGVGHGNPVPFPENKFLIGINKGGMDHPIFGANLRCLTGWFGAAVYGLPWLMTYCQLFGIPFRVATAKGEKAKADAEKALKSLGAGGWAVATENFSFELHDALKGGQSLPQAELIKLANEECDNLILGQTLTGSRGDGSSYALGKVHEGIREETVKDVGVILREVLNTQLIPAIVEMNLGHVPDKLPRLEFEIPGSRLNQDKVDYVDSLINRVGLDVSEQFIYDTLDIPQPGEGDKLFKSRRSQNDSYENREDDDDISAALAKKKR